jgi:pimeloyl-ACP methyl ester carboxylesterase
LARAGFHVLRFDYLGTGDSSGEVEDASVAQWIADINRAVEELSRSFDMHDISLIGLRLGATLAAHAAAEGGRVSRLVLWEPVIDGREYVTMQLALHRAWLEEEARYGRKAESANDELLGCRLTERLRRDLEKLSLNSLENPPAPNVYLLSQGHSHDYELLTERLRARGAQIHLDCVDGPRVWSMTPSMEESSVPNAAIQAIVSWLSGACR